LKKKSIITEYQDISAFSGQQAECSHHLLFGRGIRELADEDGVWIPLTNSEHNMSPYGLQYQIHENPVAEKLSKIAGQLAWEKEYIAKKLAATSSLKEVMYKEAREEFRKRYGISYL
jgi:hypothetical protein